MANNYDYIQLKEIIAAVRSLIDDAQYDSSVIIRAANDFQNELFTRYRLRMAESSATINISAGATSVEFPSDFLTLLEFSLLASATQAESIKDDYVNYEQFMRGHASFAIAAAGRPNAWTEFGGGARFTQPSDANYAFNIDYIRLPKLMRADSDKSELRRVWQEIINIGTLARIMEINEDYAEASQERDKLDTMLTNFVLREGRGNMKTGPMIIGTRRGSRNNHGTRRL